MRIFTVALATLLSLFAIAGQAQSYNLEKSDIAGKNILKVNLTSLLIRNYSFQYERVLTRSVSLAISYRFMPLGSAPFENYIINNSPEIEAERFDQMKVGNTAFTPELRFYFGKKRFGRGFYLAPFYRFARYDAVDVPGVYDPSDPDSNQVNLLGKGKLSVNSGGLLVGAQWNLGRVLVLDWWIIGPHYGKSNGNFDAVSSRPLTEEEQAEFEESSDSATPQFGIESTVTVNSNGFNAELFGPLPGLRAGLQLGIRF